MASAFKIDKGIVPGAGALSTAGGRAPRFPLGDMEIGDSFLIATTPETHRKQVSIITNAANAYKLRHQRAFMTRTVEGGIRVWRIA